MEQVKFAEHLAVFAEVCRLGSFSGAARKLCVTPSSIGRQIDALEADLGVKLLTRSTRALTPTDAGELLLRRAKAVLDDLTDIRAEVAGFDGKVCGVLRVACLPTFGKRFVLPALRELLSEHPGLSAELDLTERMADPVAERLDAVIRVGDLPDTSLIATKLAAHERKLIASPAYLERHGTPESALALAGHRLLDKIHGADLLGWHRLLGCGTRDFEQGYTIFRCDDFEALRSAALAGFGIGFLPSWVVGEDIAAGLLIELLPNLVAKAGAAGGIYLLRALPQPTATVAAFMGALRKTIGSPPVWDKSLAASEAARLLESSSG